MWLLPNIDNCLCMLDLYSGNSAAYREWMEHSAPDENQDFYNQVIEETRQMAKFYPGYLKEHTGTEVFTENTLQGKLPEAGSKNPYGSSDRDTEKEADLRSN